MLGGTARKARVLSLLRTIALGGILGGALLAPAPTRVAAQDAVDEAVASEAVPAPDAVPDAAEVPAPSALPAPAEAPPIAVPRQAVVVDAVSYGIAPIVGRVTSDQMRRTVEAMGYSLLPPTTTLQALQGLRVPFPPSPADLWRLAWATRSHRSVFARVWAAEGRYVVEVVVASIDGTGPFVVTDTSNGDDLREVVDRVTRRALPATATWEGPEPSFDTPRRDTLGQPVVVQPGVQGGVVRRRGVREELGHPSARDGQRWRPREPDIRRFSIALQTEASVGTTQGSFYNHFVGLRLDARLTRDLIVGVYGAYVNLEGRGGRGDDFFLMVQGEDRIRPSSTLDLTIPLRLGVGYLPFNGPVFRVSAGLNYAITPNWEIGIDLVAPTFYALPNRLAVAFDFGLELAYRL